MDYRALAELVFFAFVGLSIAIFTGALSLRLVLKPFFGRFLEAYREKNAGTLPGEAERRIEVLESRLLEMETELDEVRAARDFDRQLRVGSGDYES